MLLNTVANGHTRLFKCKVVKILKIKNSVSQSRQPYVASSDHVKTQNRYTIFRPNIGVNGTEVEHFHRHRNFYWEMLLQSLPSTQNFAAARCEWQMCLTAPWRGGGSPIKASLWIQPPMCRKYRDRGVHCTTPWGPSQQIPDRGHYAEQNDAVSVTKILPPKNK